MNAARKCRGLLTMEALMEHAQISFLRFVCSSVSGLPLKRVSRTHTSRSTSVARSHVSSTPAQRMGCDGVRVMWRHGFIAAAYCL